MTWVGRPSKNGYFIRMAKLAAERSTCRRRHVGCILVNSVGHVLATGYNGVGRGLPHCLNGYPCPSADAPSGTDLDGCRAIHAEQNALLQCSNVDNIYSCYTTTEPCETCAKLLLNTSCVNVYYLEPYAHGGEAGSTWEKRGGLWSQVNEDGCLV